MEMAIELIRRKAEEAFLCVRMTICTAGDRDTHAHTRETPDQRFLDVRRPDVGKNNELRLRANCHSTLMSCLRRSVVTIVPRDAAEDPLLLDVIAKLFFCPTLVNSYEFLSPERHPVPFCIAGTGINSLIFGGVWLSK